MKKSNETKNKEGKCTCPYCKEEIAVSPPSFCQPCGVTLRYCVRCQIAVVREAKTCPNCGGELEWR